MIKLLNFFLTLAAGVLTCFGTGLALYQYYGWFVFSHIQGMPPLTLANCVGLGSLLGLVVSLSRLSLILTKAPEPEVERTDSERSAHIVGYMIGFVVGMGILMLSGFCLNKILY